MASVERVEGGYRARWRTPDGASRSRTFRRKIDAERHLTSMEHARHSHTYVDPSGGRIRFEDWTQRWLATIVSLRASTVERDRGYVQRYLLPAFGRTPIGDIDYLGVTGWVADLSARGLAPATVVKAAQIMGKIMRAAVQAKLLASSPVVGVQLPRVERTEMRFLSPAEVATLSEMIDPRYSAAVLVAAYGGLRAGELFGLRVGKVDPLRSSIEVAEIVTEVKGSQVFGPPKTRAGRRQVPLPRFVTDAVELHLRGRPLPDHVFPSPAGEAVRLGLWRRRFWVPATTAAGLSGLRIHDLRHTAVALWLAAGASPVEVARRAGHTSTVTVLDRYGHVLPSTRDQVTDALDVMGRSARPSPEAAIRLLSS